METTLVPNLPVSAVASIIERAAAAGWDDVLPLAGGEPRFNPPPGVIEALVTARPDELTKYTPFRGTPELLSAVRAKLKTINGLAVPDDEVIAVPGGAQALFSAISVCLDDQRREVVLVDPCWEHYPNIVRAAQASPVIVSTTVNGVHNSINLEALKQALSSRTAAVVLNAPLNPTGSMLSAEEIYEVGEVCNRVGARLIVDEEYETFVHAGSRHVTVRSVYPDAISLFSLSKSFSLTGIRLGYATAPANVIDGMKRFGLYSYMYSSSPAMVLATAALHCDLPDYLEGVRAEYEKKARRLVDGLSIIPGVDCAMPEGGLYVFPRFPGPNGISRAEELIERAHLLCVPGEVAGDTGRGHVRLFVGRSDAENDEAVRRIAALVDGNL